MCMPVRMACYKAYTLQIHAHCLVYTHGRAETFTVAVVKRGFKKPKSEKVRGRGEVRHFESERDVL